MCVVCWLRFSARWRGERRQHEVDVEMSAHARSVCLLNLELRHMYTLHAMVVFVTSPPPRVAHGRCTPIRHCRFAMTDSPPTDSPPDRFATDRFATDRLATADSPLPTRQDRFATDRFATDRFAKMVFKPNLTFPTKVQLLEWCLNLT